MDFKQLEAFVNVVKHKSFSKAAEATFLTQPTISVHIKNLENELGVILIDRQDRKLTATPQVLPDSRAFLFEQSLFYTFLKALFSIFNLSFFSLHVFQHFSQFYQSIAPVTYFIFFFQRKRSESSVISVRDEVRIITEALIAFFLHGNSA